jgi:hypothetical protein
MDNKITSSEGFNPERIRSQTSRGIIVTGFVSLLFSIAVFILGLFLFPFTSTLPDSVGIGSNTRPVNWSVLEGMASLATLALVVGGVVFAFIDYIQNAIQRKRDDAEASFNIYREVYDRLMNPEAIIARRWIIENLPTLEDTGNDKKIWLDRINIKLNEVHHGWKGERPPGKEYLKEILNTFDFIGFVAKHYWNMENELVMWMSPLIAKIWERIEYYVEEEARQRNEPDYYESARQFGKYCVEWRQKHYPKSNFVKNAT